MTTPFVPDSRLTAIALGFKNAGFIADRVAPRMDTGGTSSFRWTEYNIEDTFTIPKTLVGRKGVPNKVEFGATEHDDSVLDYGLADDVPYDDIMKAQNHPSFDPEGRASMKLSELVALDREKRVANKTMNSASYNHSEIITGTDKWTNAASKPITQLVDAMNTPLVTPNVLILGKAEAWALRQNPQILKAFHGNTGDEGLVPLSFIQQMLELDEIIVGESRYNASRKGQPVTLNHLWTGGASLIYRKAAAQLQDDVTFLLTAEWGGRIANRQVKQAGELGLRGGVTITVGDSVKEVQISKEAGYFLEGVV